MHNPDAIWPFGGVVLRDKANMMQLRLRRSTTRREYSDTERLGPFVNTHFSSMSSVSDPVADP